MAAGKKRSPVINHDPFDELASASEQAVATADTPLQLGDSLSIRDVAQLKEVISSALDIGTPIVILGGEVERIDGAGIQLLCMLIKACEEKHVEISWDAVSPVIEDAARLLGVETALRFSGSEKAA